MARSDKCLFKRGNTYYFKKRVPRSVADLDPREQVWVSLQTDSEVEAKALVVDMARAMQRYWEGLLHGQGDTARERLAAAKQIARHHGFAYRSRSRILDDGDDLEARLLKIEKIGTKRTEDAKAILGHASEGGLRLSEALEEYFSLTRDEVRGKTDKEAHRWRLPKDRAVRNFVDLIGDKPLSEISREDARAFRTWWNDRIESEGLKTNSANKDIQHLSGIFKKIEKVWESGLRNPFTGLQMKERDGGKRPSFKAEFIRDTLLDPARLAGLNEEARMIFYAMIDTGCGPSEISGLDPDEIFLDAPIPHIWIRPNANRGVKEVQRAREIPLVGAALQAFRAFPEGFPAYRGKAASASATMGKFLRENELLPTPDHTAYSVRHSFRERLRAVGAPVEVCAAVMGHKLTDVHFAYGDPPPLEETFPWMQKIAFSTPEAPN